MKEYSIDHLKSVLLEVDEEAELEFGTPDEPFQVIIVGGSALILLELTDRSMTRDIDAIEYDSRLRTILARHPELNSRAFVHSRFLPDGWDKRLIDLGLPTKAVRFLVPSLEDLAIMKLYSMRDQDREDLNSLAFIKQLDWEKLEFLAKDAKGADINLVSEREYREMLHAYENYREWNAR